MRNFVPFLRRALPFALVVLAAAAYGPPAFAADGGQVDGTIGQRIQVAMNDMVGPLLFFVTLASTLGGVFLMAKGLLKLKDSHQDQNAFRTAFTCIAAATVLIALPEAAGIGMNSVMGTQGMMFQTSELKLVADALDGVTAAGQAPGISQRASSLVNVGGVNPCINGGIDSTVSCMAENLAKNVVPVGIIAVFAFVYLWGLWGLASYLFELARHSSERGGGSPQGFYTKGLTSILALTMLSLFMAVSQTIMGNVGPVGETGINAGSDILSYGLSGANVIQQYGKLIGYVFHILALFGVIAFAKGLFILKGVGDQRQNATFSHGIVFMIAGILMANAKLSTCTLMGTLSGFSAAKVVGFCT